jgi:hypothetical protein
MRGRRWRLRSADPDFSYLPGLTTGSSDSRPNLRRDGLEIFFDSTRAGGIDGIDLWTSTRASMSDPWSTPTNLGSAINSSANDLRESLSWDGATLYFGSTRSGGRGAAGPLRHDAIEGDGF